MRKEGGARVMQEEGGRGNGEGRRKEKGEERRHEVK